jgi:uncharacterized protein
MRLVFDTNIAVSALLWHGPPRQLLDQIIDGSAVELYSSPVLLNELSEVLGRPKFAQRINAAGLTVEMLLADYVDLVSTVLPIPLTQPVSRDPDDDAVLACAIAANANAIVSGDRDLLVRKIFQNISIVTASQMIAIIAE